MRTSIIIIAYFCLILNCCKDKEDCTPQKEQPYLRVIYEFQLVDVGSGNGFCGPIIETKDSGISNTISYKAVNLPSGISFSLDDKYKGVFEVLPETYKCMDSRPDPIPGKPSPTIYPHFVNIIEWEKK